MVDQTPPVPNTVVNLDYYRVKYIDEIQTVAVYKGTSLEPIATWVDNGLIVPHGPGYRHIGANFHRASANGIQLTSFSARDAA